MKVIYVASVILGIYLCGAFIAATCNIKEWDIVLRSFAGLFMLIAIVIGVAYISDDTENE